MNSRGIAAMLWLGMASTAQSEVLTVPLVQGTHFGRDVALAPRIRSSSDLPTPGLIQARKAMVQKRRLSLGTLRSLADAGDGLAAHQLAERLAAKDRSDLAADTAHYYSIAAAKGRSYAVRGMVTAIDQIDQSAVHPRRLAELKKVLFAYVKAGHPLAVKAALAYHLSAHPFGDLSHEMRTLALASNTSGAGGIALQLASITLQNSAADAAALAEAQTLLGIAQQSPSFSQRVTATNLLPLVQARLDQFPPQQQEAN